MKKFVKGILILSLLLFITGTGCVIAGCVMGITSGDIANALKKLPFIDFGNQIIIPGDSIIQIPVDEEEEVVDEKVWDFKKEEVKNIELDLAGVNCQIQESETDRIQVVLDGNLPFHISLENNTLVVEKDSHLMDNENGMIHIYLPINWNLERFELNAGAGNINVDCPIQTHIFKMEAGASFVQVNSPIIANEFEAELGAGKAHFDLVDAGHIEITNGAGQTEIGLSGQKENYQVIIESAAGNVNYGEETFAGIANTYRDHPKDADRTIEIESALGEVTVTFEEVV
ncbi:MAG: DUF4097 domain-containing protein [Lachnospiraceae bacterium]|nr:DUF4097 domain-containing protein [Lachnospiraceae bacterium]